ncbi:MAG: hypothetical protein NTW62_00030 [Candidatus Nomurabacteria bacterium]|nr:hypothetical protein [Candidatus Nomurabacteria bacterium]
MASKEDFRKKLVDLFLNTNKCRSVLFLAEASIRKAYREMFPTEIASLECMDGRVDVTYITKTPIGIIQVYSEGGGQFDFGWFSFGWLIRRWVKYSLKKKRNKIILCSYHFSKGDKHRCCAWFKYDTEAAKKHQQYLVSQFKSAFKKNHEVYPIMIGVDTDTDGIIVHGIDGKILDLREFNSDKKELLIGIKELFPQMTDCVIKDFAQLLLGNIQHIKEVKELNRPIQSIDHQEQFLFLGRGFEWFNLLNKALEVGPYNPDLSKPIIVAAKVLLQNIQKGRIPAEEGILLVTSAVYGTDDNTEYHHGLAKARFLAKFAKEVIADNVKELLPYLHEEPLVGVLNFDTFEYKEIGLEPVEDVKEEVLV